MRTSRGDCGAGDVSISPRTQGTEAIGRRPSRARPSMAVLAAAGAVVVLILLAAVYMATQETVWVEINGLRLAHRTHERTSAGVLRELDLNLGSSDLVEIPTSAEILEGEPIRISVARPVTMLHDGVVSTGLSQAHLFIEAMSDLGVSVLPEDRYYMANESCDLYGELPTPRPNGRRSPADVVAGLRTPITLAVQRAVAFSVRDGGVMYTFRTVAHTVGEALYEQGVTIYGGDQVVPPLSTPVTPGLNVLLERATPVLLDVGGQTRSLRTRAQTVHDLLHAEKVTLDEDDYVVPDASEPVTDDLTVRVVHVSEQRFVEEVPVPYDVVEVPDANLEIDQRQVTVWGWEGALRHAYLVRYENGEEVSRVLEDQWLERDPQNRQIHYGTKIVLREVTMPEGVYTYWRILRVLATSYNAPTAGTPFDSPYYGYTYLGWKAAKGIIAVDPRVISLRTRMYVPGYGPGTAADTGGAIKWRRIDLCYDDDNLVLWKKWVDAYLLTPVPSRSDILWQVPNWPVEKE